jgi:hypothetical protein
MGVQLEITYEKLLELINQLSEDKQRDLISHLLQQAEKRKLTPEEKLALYHASIMTVPINEEPSIRREDWYGDDGR